MNKQRKKDEGEIKKRSEIERLKSAFDYDLNLYKRTGNQIYIDCAEATLNSILEKGYRGVYAKLVCELLIKKGGND